MTELSPQAQAVHDAYCKETYYYESNGLAAALRAAADQVAPDDAVEPRNYIPAAIECRRIRTELLAIAAELND